MLKKIILIKKKWWYLEILHCTGMIQDNCIYLKIRTLNSCKNIKATKCNSACILIKCCQYLVLTVIHERNWVNITILKIVVFCTIVASTDN